jgi:pimeloyl-ACP methyl ester carboxylesterase
MPDPLNPDASQSPVLILIHGATLNGHMWDPVRRHLDPGLRVIAPDLPGHGTRRNERFTMEAAVATVAQAARSVAPSPVILAGDSLGGYTVLDAASAIPAGQLSGVIASGCTADFTKLATKLPFMARVLMFKLLLALFGERRLIGNAIEKVRVMLSGAQVLREDIDSMVAAGFSLRVFEQAVDALRLIDHIARLAAITVPVTLVNGDKDPVMIRHEAAYLAAAQRGSVRRYDCEHGVSMARSVEFAALLNAAARSI